MSKDDAMERLNRAIEDADKAARSVFELVENVVSYEESNQVAEKLARNYQAAAVSLQAVPLRDWFAGQYLAGQVSQLRGPIRYFDSIAADAYALADAMMRMRAITYVQAMGGGEEEEGEARDD